MVALAAVTVVGWLVLLQMQPVVAWPVLILVTAIVVAAVWRRIERRGVGRRSHGPSAPRRSTAPASARRAAGGPPTDRARAADDAQRLTGAQLEQLVADLLDRDGFDVELSGGAGDRGADVKAISPQHNLVVVQCKSYRDKPVDDPMMQTFLGTARQVHNAAIPLYVTTSRFTAPARQLAREHGIVLVDGRTLAEWARGDWWLPDEPTEFVGEIRAS